jgi:hypothetical protein
VIARHKEDMLKFPDHQLKGGSQNCLVIRDIASQDQGVLLVCVLRECFAPVAVRIKSMIQALYRYGSLEHSLIHLGFDELSRLLSGAQGTCDP